MEPKDFQEATAKRILNIFEQENQKRVLLSDEVGLGKTIVASAVVKKLADDYKGKDPFKVIYVCSNINIANQNCRKLGISEDNCVSFSDGRLSMQHLRIAETKKQVNNNVQLIPMTPSTSFDMKSSSGTQNERALMYVILSQYGDVLSKIEYQTRLMRFMQFDMKLHHWETYVADYQARVKNCVNDQDSDYLNNMNLALDKEFQNNSSMYSDLINMISAGEETDFDRIKQKCIILELRKIFARISLKNLNPNLVIMDEFQKFKDLIDTSQSTEASILANQFLKNGDTNVLLLSATPYRPYSTLEELVEDEGHYEEFIRVMDFLLSDSNKKVKFKNIWGKYSRDLAELKTDDFSELINSKIQAESELYKCICRTERRNGTIFSVDKAARMNSISEEDIYTYVEMQNLVNATTSGKIHVDYAKSSPYLMSFMNYTVKSDIEDALAENRRIPEITRSKYLFLENKAINGYGEIKCNNARLQLLFNEAFGHGKNGAELLLWIPASRPYYRTNNVFSQNAGYSKTLVFSSWEMVPRMIATMTSYEAERLVVNRLPKSRKRKSYFAEEVETENDAKQGDSTEQINAGKKRKKRKVSMRLKNDTAEIIRHTCIFLADLYNPIEFMDLPLFEIRKTLTSKVETKLKQLQGELNLEYCRKGASNILQLLKALDGKDLDKLEAIPTDVVKLLVNMAIGSPAICAYRLLKSEKSARDIAEKFVTLFNKPESMAILDASYPGEGYYYEAVIRYCAGGNLQAVLDEYAYVLNSEGDKLVKQICEGIIDTTKIPIETKESFVTGKDKPSIRCHFAVGYFNARVSEKSVQRTENIRNAFNSPFRPFVLASTSIGQEGLDFHAYSRKIMHWNLPSNPTDFEQREGRINRYLCHAIRQNLAENIKYKGEPQKNIWENLLNKAKADLTPGYSELVPYWCLPDDYPYTRYIERIVPMYPYSLDEIKYDELIDVLMLYRLTLGQPRQEELLESIKLKNVDHKLLADLYINLSPWDHARREYSEDING